MACRSWPCGRAYGPGLARPGAIGDRRPPRLAVHDDRHQDHGGVSMSVAAVLAGIVMRFSISRTVRYFLTVQFTSVWWTGIQSLSPHRNSAPLRLTGKIIHSSESREAGYCGPRHVLPCRRICRRRVPLGWFAARFLFAGSRRPLGVHHRTCRILAVTRQMATAPSGSACGRSGRPQCPPRASASSRVWEARARVAPAVLGSIVPSITHGPPACASREAFWSSTIASSCWSDRFLSALLCSTLCSRGNQQRQNLQVPGWLRPTHSRDSLLPVLPEVAQKRANDLLA